MQKTEEMKHREETDREMNRYPNGGEAVQNYWSLGISYLVF